MSSQSAPPPAKRARKSGSGDKSKPVVSSKLFAPYRTVGLVSPTLVPFTSVPLGKTTFQITTSIGHALQTYDLRRGLNLNFITRPQTPGLITASASWNDKVIGAWYSSSTENGIWVFKRGKKVGELQQPPKKQLSHPIRSIVIFGNWIVGCSASSIEIWSTSSTSKSSQISHYTSLQSPGFDESTPYGPNPAICTLPTYINKVFVGRTDGAVEIWNVSTAKLVYTMLPQSAEWGRVTALQAAPALSLIAIAYSKGPVIIQNVRTDEPVIVLGGVEGGNNMAVTSITFRTDDLGAGEDGRASGIIATASNTHGDITFWDLNNGGRKAAVLRGAHNAHVSADSSIPKGGITGIEFLPGQAIIVSTGLDNCLRTWIFDESPFSPIPRQLHIRAGHASTVSQLEFLPSDSESADFAGKWLMSASQDRTFWGWSLRRDGQSTEISQGSIAKKAKKMGLLNGKGEGAEALRAPPVTAIACSLNRDGGMGAAPNSGKTIWTDPKKNKIKALSTEDTSMTGWESVVTAHKSDRFARTWFWGRKRAGRWMFETGDSKNVSTVAISPCGTFAIVGSEGGAIEAWNLQSGRQRQRFPSQITADQAKRLAIERAAKGEFSVITGRRQYFKGEGRHRSAVTGIALDDVNRVLMSSGEDGILKFWDFKNGQHEDELSWASVTSIKALKYHSPTGLVALKCNDGTVIRLVDTSTKKVVREFVARSPILDFTFSHDGRWIVGAGEDSVVRVWDIPTAHLVDLMRLRHKCISLAFSTTGEYLATSSEGSVGVDIWANRTLFAHVPTRPLNEDVDVPHAAVLAPTASGEGGTGVVDAMLEASEKAGSGDDDDIDLASAVPPPSTDALAEGLVTLSIVPRPRWQTLMNLDEIRQRNKPKEAPKKPEKAPFFLPTAGGQDGVPAPATAAVAAKPADKERSGQQLPSFAAVSGKGSDPTVAFQELLQRVIDTPPAADLDSDSDSLHEPADALVAYLSSLSPASTDLAIRTLSPAQPYDELVAFVRALTCRARRGLDFELVVVWMRVLLRVHAEVLAPAVGRRQRPRQPQQQQEGGEVEESGRLDAPAGEEEGNALRAALQSWQDVLASQSIRLEEKVGFCAGVGAWLRGVV